MLEKDIRFDSVKFNFYDSGHKETLINAKEILKEDGAPNILEKPNEAIWFVDNNVVKFSIDENFIKNRFTRSSILYPYVPQVNKATENMYSYNYVNGNIFSEVL